MPPAREATRALHNDWWVYSFSQLARAEAGGDTASAATLPAPGGHDEPENADDTAPVEAFDPRFAGNRYGVALHAVWQLLRQAAGDWPALAAQLGWPLPHLEGIDAYRDSAARYHFVTTGEATALLAAHGFEVQWMASGSYAMAGQCPTVVLRRTQRADGAFA